MRGLTFTPRLLAVALGALLLALAAVPAASYLPQFTRAQNQAAMNRWDFSAFPVTWQLNPARRDNIQGGRPVEAAIEAAFASWRNAPNAVVQVSRGPDTDSTRRGFNREGANENLICFVCEADFGDESETLAITVTTVSTGSGGNDGRGGRTRFAGQILDSDIFFNHRRTWSTDAPGNEILDLETIALHEIGHFLGLDHSGVVRATMFAFAPPELRSLSYDDVAGISFLYPKPVPDLRTGSLTGTIRRGGAGVFGAHVYAESLTTADPLGARGIRKSPIGILTNPDGSYRIDGLPPDSYTVIVEPLDKPLENRNVSSFPEAHGRGSVDTGFTTRWY